MIFPCAQISRRVAALMTRWRRLSGAGRRAMSLVTPRGARQLRQPTPDDGGAGRHDGGTGARLGTPGA